MAVANYINHMIPVTLSHDTMVTDYCVVTMCHIIDAVQIRLVLLIIEE